MTSEEQAQDAIRNTATDFEQSAETHRERSDLPGTPSAATAQSTRPSGGEAPDTLFAKVVGIRR